MKSPFSFLFLFIALFGSEFATAQVTFSEDIAPIIFNNCTNCHRDGEVGPMPFTNYQEVSSWASMIKFVTETNNMPPWPPNAEYRHFVGERVLSDSEKQLIADWANSGAPEGDPALTPDLPEFPEGSQIGTPDVLLSMTEPHTVPGNSLDDYRVFVIPTGFTEQKEISSIEFRPGNTRAVHHVLFAWDTTGSAAALDAQSAEYGYQVFGDFGIEEAVDLTWGYVPGVAPLIYPEGIGEFIPAGADLLVQVHFAPLATDETDQSTINIFFKDSSDPITRPVQAGSITPFNLPGGWNSFQIPPDEEVTFNAESIYDGDAWFPGIDYDISLIGADVHAHYLGTSYEIFAVTPAGDTINIIDVPEWDFNWQGTYIMENMVKIPANSSFYTIATYDNTTANPHNPSNPPQAVAWGEGTYDEMLLAALMYVPYEEGDELIEMGATGVSDNRMKPSDTKLFPPSPNPSSNSAEISFVTSVSGPVSLYITDMTGKLVETITEAEYRQKGKHKVMLNTSRFDAGNYLVNLRSNASNHSQRLTIIK